MNIRMGLAAITFLALLASTTCFASSVTGPIQILRSLKPANGGPARIAIMITGAATGCSVTGWYAFENGDTGVGKVWASFLLTAYTLGKDITVVGDGVCHTYSDLGPTTTLEGVGRVELQ